MIPFGPYALDGRALRMSGVYAAKCWTRPHGSSRTGGLARGETQRNERTDQVEARLENNSHSTRTTTLAADAAPVWRHHRI